MMTHGAVVAREYGIPAILGVDQANPGGCGPASASVSAGQAVKSSCWMGPAKINSY